MSKLYQPSFEVSDTELNKYTKYAFKEVHDGYQQEGEINSRCGLTMLSLLTVIEDNYISGVQDIE